MVKSRPRRKLHARVEGLPYTPGVSLIHLVVPSNDDCRRLTRQSELVQVGHALFERDLTHLLTVDVDRFVEPEGAVSFFAQPSPLFGRRQVPMRRTTAKPHGLIPPPVFRRLGFPVPIPTAALGRRPPACIRRPAPARVFGRIPNLVKQSGFARIAGGLRLGRLVRDPSDEFLRPQNRSQPIAMLRTHRLIREPAVKLFISQNCGRYSASSRFSDFFEEGCVGMGIRLPVTASAKRAHRSFDVSSSGRFASTSLAGAALPLLPRNTSPT